MAYDWVEGRHADQYLLKKEVASVNGLTTLLRPFVLGDWQRAFAIARSQGYLCVLSKRKSQGGR